MRQLFHFNELLFELDIFCPVHIPCVKLVCIFNGYILELCMVYRLGAVDRFNCGKPEKLLQLRTFHLNLNDLAPLVNE